MNKYYLLPLVIAAIAFPLATKADILDSIDLISYGNSNSIQVNMPDCGYQSSGCIISTTGNSFIPEIGGGSFTTILNSNWVGNSTLNGKGGYCTPTSGTGAFALNNSVGNSLHMTVSGTTCDQGVTNPVGYHVFKGQFTITDSLGSFIGSQGSGALTTIDNGNGSGWYVATGLALIPHSMLLPDGTATASSTPGISSSSTISSGALVTPSSIMVHPGQHIDFTGKGFEHEENVSVYFNTILLVKAYADGGGNFTTGSIAVPLGVGNYSYSFVGDSSGISATSSVTVR